MTASRVRPMRGAASIAAAAVLIVSAPGAAHAQRVQTYPIEPPAIAISPPETDPSAGSVFLASAVLPGAGQYRLGAGRWVAYVGVETWAWINWVDARNDAADLERAYRDLAWSVARRISTGERDDREFEYYEAMSHFPASGSFDADPAEPGTQPEENAATFNGDLWKLAREIFFPAGGDSIPPTEEERALALAFYEQKAIGPQYAWSWGSNQLELQHFRSLIRRSDGAARTSTTLLGVILVNHVVSAVDALIAARLRGPEGKPGSLRLRGEALPGPYGLTPVVVFELATP